MGKKVIVVGAGFAGLTAAALLADQGFDVTVLEKNEMAGGRARVWQKDGFTFDMGPSWYLMPEVFDAFFARLNRKREDYYQLVKLDPFYRVFFGSHETVDIKSDAEHNKAVFDSFEYDGGEKLTRYLDGSKYKYDTAMKDFMYIDYKSLSQFINRRVVTEGVKLNLFSSLDHYVSKFFSDRRSKQILEYAMVFLGNSPYNAPALYSIMSHVDFNLGVWYPVGGMGEVVKGMTRLCEELGVTFRFEHPVTGLSIQGNRVTGVSTPQGEWPADLVVMNADYPYAETQLIPESHQTYPAAYWAKKIMAPSMLLAYLGVNKKLDGLVHHNLYFAADWDEHFQQIFNKPAWPDDPCYYVGSPSRTDSSVSPPGQENVFLLIPIAPGLDDTPEIREQAFHDRITHLEKLLGESISDHIVVKRLYSVRDFSSDYNAYRGTALGLAHTLNQTAVFRPAHQSKKVKNLYYTGHYNHPGVGVPMTIISSEIVATEIRKDLT